MLADRCHLEPTGRPLGHAKFMRRVGRSRGLPSEPFGYADMEARPCCARPSHRDRAQLIPALLEAIMNAKHANLTLNGRRELKKRALGPARNSSRSGFRTSSITSRPAPTSIRRAFLPSWKSPTRHLGERSFPPCVAEWAFRFRTASGEDSVTSFGTNTTTN